MRRIGWVAVVAGAALAALLLMWARGDGPSPRATRTSASIVRAERRAPSVSHRPSRPRWDTADAPWLEDAMVAAQPEGARPRSGIQRSLPDIEPPRRDGSVRTLARATGWWDSVRASARLPHATLDARLSAWKEALALATDPRARQNLIFQAALVFPWDTVRPWLVELWRGDDPDDAEDALLALAFSGHPEARAAFRDLARAPEDVRLVRSLCGQVEEWAVPGVSPEDVRRRERSFRAIEVLDREPYHERLCFQAWYFWTDHPVAMLADWERLESELLRAWVARYPGHPGLDDMALRIARNETDPMEAARWYSRAACWPDQDVTDGGLFGLVTMAELYLTPEQVDRLAHEEGFDTANRMLLLYVRLRRLAVDRGFATALREAEARARAEPGCPLAHAWNRRGSVAPTRALDSGQVPLPADDPLRVVLAAPPPPEAPARPPVRLARRWFPPHAERMAKREAVALAPFGERIALDIDVLARQFRTWETLAALEDRARVAGRAARSDLLYKQAAVYYHEPDALYPVWCAHTMDAPSIFRVRSAVHAAAGDLDARVLDFRDRSLSLRRAVALFNAIEAEDGGYAGMDEVVFSRGMAWKKLMEIRPFRPWREEERFSMVRSLVSEFERCAGEFPSSPLAGPARGAAAWWRRNVPGAWASG